MAASLYFKHFSLTSAPFPVTPDSDAYYTGGSRRATVDAVLHVLCGEHGIVKVVGDAGTGKTTLCRHLALTLGKQFTVLYTCDPSLTGDRARPRADRCRRARPSLALGYNRGLSSRSTSPPDGCRTPQPEPVADRRPPLPPR